MRARATRRWVRVLPWALWTAFVVVLLIAIAAGLSNARSQPLHVMDVVWAVSFIGFPTTGAVIASRLPDRPLGWMFCVAPLLMMTGVALSEFAGWHTTSGGLASWLEWASGITFDAGFAAFVIVPFFLPSGTLTRDRWRTVARASMIGAGVLVTASAFAPADASEFRTGRNPMQIDSLAPILEPATEFLELAMLVALVTALVSVVVRHRRARGVDRLQSKWVAFGASSVAAAVGSLSLVDVFVEIPEVVSTPIMIGLIVALPATIGIAMLRYRLYDIDVIINRTLVYGLLTAILVGTYAGAVLLFRTVLDPVTGENDLAIAASTLAVAALFGPARRRVQAFIDRRFYRARYDAQVTLEAFAARLRDEVDLDAVTQELETVVGETMHPQHIGVWIR